MLQSTLCIIQPSRAPFPRVRAALRNTTENQPSLPPPARAASPCRGPSWHRDGEAISSYRRQQEADCVLQGKALLETEYSMIPFLFFFSPSNLHHYISNYAIAWSSGEQRKTSAVLPEPLFSSPSGTLRLHRSGSLPHLVPCSSSTLLPP